MKYIVLLVLLFGGVGLSLAAELKKPTIMTSPPKYLKSVPLGEIPVETVIDVLGVPDKSYELAGRTYLSYELGSGYGLRQFVYIVEDGVLVDIQYNDQGPYNGSKASELQQE